MQSDKVVSKSVVFCWFSAFLRNITEILWSLKNAHNSSPFITFAWDQLYTVHIFMARINLQTINRNGG